MNTLWIVLLTAYLLGSLPFAYWIAHYARGVDPRTVAMGISARRMFS